MIIDSHCHAWEDWPYDPSVPDTLTRGSLDQLVYEMDRNGVDRALIVCAEIQGNPANNQYIFENVKKHDDRFSFVIDVDSFWKDTYHTSGAAKRLTEGVTNWQPAGFTHYVADEADDGAWLYSNDGLEMFEVAQEQHLIASIHCRPQHQQHIRELAKRFPKLTILIHHMGHPKAIEPEGLAEILATATYDNVRIKVSGFYNTTTQPQWDFPLADVQPTVHALYQRFGAKRLLWGSDYPVCRRFFSHRHAIEILRHHCDFISSSDMDDIMGKNLEGLLS
jgi:L-fuconolactonase